MEISSVSFVQISSVSHAAKPCSSCNHEAAEKHEIRAGEASQAEEGQADRPAHADQA